MSWEVPDGHKTRSHRGARRGVERPLEDVCGDNALIRESWLPLEVPAAHQGRLDGPLLGALVSICASSPFAVPQGSEGSGQNRT